MPENPPTGIRTRLRAYLHGSQQWSESIVFLVGGLVVATLIGIFWSDPPWTVAVPFILAAAMLVLTAWRRLKGRGRSSDR